MTGDILRGLGGLGLFLIGMTIMTDGLRSLAGDALRHALAKFTTSPWTGAATGAIGTAVLQSSSATTVMAVGFAGAGLITFSQALGILFGANLGTTVTGWLVALLGFKLQLTEVVMPLIFVGAMMRLLGRRRVAACGYTLAGFGLVFAGIGMLQNGMEGLGGVVTPESFPPNTLTGRFLLVLIGMAVTLVTQSSSAGVATAITAVHTGTISLTQAAAMVIGMNIGTTFTALIAAAGGSVNARRTGYAHFIFNVMTGFGAFLILPLFVTSWNLAAPLAVRSDREIALVSFHTLFNGIGVLAILPFTHAFARLIVRLVPRRSGELTGRLDPSLLSDPNIALDTVDATLRDISRVVLRMLGAVLTGPVPPPEMDDQLDESARAIDEARAYLGQIETSRDQQNVSFRRASSLHVVDHLARLIRRCRVSRRWRRVSQDNAIRPIGRRFGNLISAMEDDPVAMTSLNGQLAPLWHEIDGRIESFRRRAIDRMAVGDATTNETLESLDAIRWLRRVVYHAWRISYHLDPSIKDEPISDQQRPIVEGDPEFVWGSNLQD